MAVEATSTFRCFRGQLRYPGGFRRSISKSFHGPSATIKKILWFFIHRPVNLADHQRSLMGHHEGHLGLQEYILGRQRGMVSHKEGPMGPQESLMNHKNF